jgi:hypothetical protein
VVAPPFVDAAKPKLGRVWAELKGLSTTDTCWRSQPDTSPFPNARKELDEKLRKHLPDMPQCQLYDLRRTAKTLLGQAGLARDRHVRRMSARAIRTSAPQ